MYLLKPYIECHLYNSSATTTIIFTILNLQNNMLPNIKRQFKYPVEVVKSPSITFIVTSVCEFYVVKLTILLAFFFLTKRLEDLHFSIP